MQRCSLEAERLRVEVEGGPVALPNVEADVPEGRHVTFMTILVVTLLGVERLDHRLGRQVHQFLGKAKSGKISRK